MTYRELCDRLAACGIEEARREACILISHFCGVSEASLLADPAKVFEEPALYAAVERRVGREPLAYILGEWEFFGDVYRVSPHCLIPRPDTELLVEQAIARLPRGAVFADLCTGSGCVAISTLRHRPDCRGMALELLPPTAALAAENGERLGVSPRLSVQVADVLDPATPERLGTVDGILSNPPYIRSRVVETLAPELFREPREALDGGADGLIFYRTILKNYAPCLAPHGFMLFEIGYDQEQEIMAVARELGYGCTVLRDLGGNPRVAVAVPERRNHGDQ